MVLMKKQPVKRVGIVKGNLIDRIEGTNEGIEFFVVEGTHTPIHESNIKKAPEHPYTQKELQHLYRGLLNKQYTYLELFNMRSAAYRRIDPQVSDAFIIQFEINLATKLKEVTPDPDLSEAIELYRDAVYKVREPGLGNLSNREIAAYLYYCGEKVTNDNIEQLLQEHEIEKHLDKPSDVVEKYNHWSAHVNRVMKGDSKRKRESVYKLYERLKTLLPGSDALKADYLQFDSYNPME